MQITGISAFTQKPKKTHILVLWMSERTVYLKYIWYSTRLVFVYTVEINQRPWLFLSCPRGVIRPWTLWGSKAIYRCSLLCASGLLLELITFWGETKYSRHIVSKKAHSITKLLSTGRLLPFITGERWNSLLVKGNACFTTLLRINMCRHFPFSSLLQKSNYTEEMLTINRLVR